MRGRALARWATLPLALMLGCGLSSQGDVPERREGHDGGADSGRSPLDAGPTLDATACVADAACLPVPTGWTLAGFDLTESGVCPPGYLPDDVVADPTVGTSACGCACTLAQPPTCPTGAIGTSSGVGSCPTPGASLPSSVPGACVNATYPVTVGEWLQLSPPAPTGGACTAMPTLQSFPVNARICTTTCGSRPCRSTLQPPFTVCVAAPGKQSCPPGFPTPHLVGSSVTFGCGGCACVVSGNCAGALTLWQNAGCSGASLTVPADGTCQYSNTPGTGTAMAYSYAATPIDAGCQASPPMPPTQPNLTAEQTICCP